MVTMTDRIRNTIEHTRAQEAEITRLREALEAVEKFIEQEIHPSGAIDAAETGAVFGPKFLIHATDTLAKVRAALGK